jgi:hypothetical protein
MDVPAVTQSACIRVVIDGGVPSHIHRASSRRDRALGRLHDRDGELVEHVPGALLAVATLVSDPDEFYEGSPGSWAAFVALCTIAITVLLALGVAINRSVDRFRAQIAPP